MAVLSRTCARVARVALSGTLVAILLLVLLASPVLAFTDVPTSHPYRVAIDDLASRGIISGFGDASFGPTQAVARQQFAKMIVLTMDLGPLPEYQNPFLDLDAGWPYPRGYVATTAAHGITTGKTSTHFDPYAHITRAQVLSMVVRAAVNLRPGTLHPASEADHCFWGNFGPPHGVNVTWAEVNGLMAGIDYQRPNPWDPMPRGEVVQVLYNLLRLMEQGTRQVTAPVTQVIDGDTIKVNLGGVIESVRLIGIDTPEVGEPSGGFLYILSGRAVPVWC